MGVFVGAHRMVFFLFFRYPAKQTHPCMYLLLCRPRSKRGSYVALRSIPIVPIPRRSHLVIFPWSIKVSGITQLGFWQASAPATQASVRRSHRAHGVKRIIGSQKKRFSSSNAATADSGRTSWGWVFPRKEAVLVNYLFPDFGAVPCWFSSGGKSGWIWVLALARQVACLNLGVDAGGRMSFGFRETKAFSSAQGANRCPSFVARCFGARFSSFQGDAPPAAMCFFFSGSTPPPSFCGRSAQLLQPDVSLLRSRCQFLTPRFSAQTPF